MIVSTSQALFAGKCKKIEESLRAAFRTFIGADTPKENKSEKASVVWNEFKKVFQATVDVGTHQMVKEFAVKEDAQHWADLVHLLQQSGKLKGHCSVIQKAEANRKATQAAYDQIMSGKGVFSAEDNPNFQNDPKLGKDVWGTMFSRYKEPKESMPGSEIRVHRGSLEEITVMGSKQCIQADLLGWKHKTLGWRVVRILHHNGQQEARESVAQQAEDLELTHVGFIRCTGNSSHPEMTDQDQIQLKRLSAKVPGAVAVIVGYKVITGVLRSFTIETAKSTGSGFTEVELGTIVRRVEGEKFLVCPAITPPSWKDVLDSKVQDHFYNKLKESMQKPQGEEEMARFKRVHILGDGHCFWHSFLFWNLQDEYLPVKQNPGGGPQNPQRLLEEIRRAKKLWQEVQELVKGASSLPASCLDDITKSPVVSVKNIENVAKAMKSHFRFTIDPEAGSWLKFIQN